MTPRRRLRPTTDHRDPPKPHDREGYKAAWWRERVMKVSRPELAERLGITSGTIFRYENSDDVPTLYKMACKGLNDGRDAW